MKQEKYTWKDLIIDTLKKKSGLTPQEILEYSKKYGFFQKGNFQGKTMDATITANLYIDMKEKNPSFYIVSRKPTKFGLRSDCTSFEMKEKDGNIAHVFEGNSRILHCGSNIENYNICVKQSIAGFAMRGPIVGEMIYVAYKNEEGESLCGARFILEKVTEEKPWGDAERYVLCYKACNTEYCKPFQLRILEKTEGKSWGVKCLVGSKVLKLESAQLLERDFKKNRISEFNELQVVEPTISREDNDEELFVSNSDDAPISIMGTFQTINFSAEQDVVMGLERLVTDNFFNLFPRYNQEEAILISENRIFKTQKGKDKGGVIPDALLITFDKSRSCPLQINMVEYECYGNSRATPQQRSEYLNKHIIPQLVQFASAFSTITDELTRKRTIESWSEKILSAIKNSENYKKVKSWLKRYDSSMNSDDTTYMIRQLLEDAFKKSVRVFLIIDEISGDQKKTIDNIIKSFLLENGSNIMFEASEVKLIQQITLTGGQSEFALTVK